MAIDVSSSKTVSYTPYPGSRRTRPTMSSGTARVTSFPDWPRETEILLGRCLFFQIDKACLDGLQILVKSPKSSHTVLTERITILKRGAMPLFYETLTGQALSGERSVAMGDVYPFVGDIGSEYFLATGSRGRLADVYIRSQVA